MTTPTTCWHDWYTGNGDVYLNWLRANHALSNVLVLADYPRALDALRKAEDALFLMSGAIETLRPQIGTKCLNCGKEVQEGLCADCFGLSPEDFR